MTEAELLAGNEKKLEEILESLGRIEEIMQARQELRERLAFVESAMREIEARACRLQGEVEAWRRHQLQMHNARAGQGGQMVGYTGHQFYPSTAGMVEREAKSMLEAVHRVFPEKKESK